MTCKVTKYTKLPNPEKAIVIVGVRPMLGVRLVIEAIDTLRDTPESELARGVISAINPAPIAAAIGRWASRSQRSKHLIVATHLDPQRRDPATWTVGGVGPHILSNEEADRKKHQIDPKHHGRPEFTHDTAQ